MLMTFFKYIDEINKKNNINKKNTKILQTNKQYKIKKKIIYDFLDQWIKTKFSEKNCLNWSYEFNIVNYTL
jgi:hypothetical protein